MCRAEQEHALAGRLAVRKAQLKNSKLPLSAALHLAIHHFLSQNHWPLISASALTEPKSIPAGSLDRRKDSTHSGDRIDHGKPMLRREMAVASRHRDRLVAGQFLDLFDRCSGHG